MIIKMSKKRRGQHHDDLTKNHIRDPAISVSATAAAPSQTPTIDSNFLNSTKGGTLTTAIAVPIPPTGDEIHIVMSTKQIPRVRNLQNCVMQKTMMVKNKILLPVRTLTRQAKNDCTHSAMIAYALDQ